MPTSVALVPEWVGAAVLGALIAALGYVGKLIVEWLTAVRNERNNRRAQLVDLLSLLSATRVSFRVQNDHSQRLAADVKRNDPNMVSVEGYEEIFSKAYSKFTPEEKELHSIIRSYTINSLRPTNQALSEWLKRDTYFKAQYRGSTLMRELAAKLAVLEAHLILWHAKYEAWIPATPQHALVYMADEKRHGVAFPSSIDQVVEKVLKEY